MPQPCPEGYLVLPALSPQFLLVTASRRPVSRTISFVDNPGEAEPSRRPPPSRTMPRSVAILRWPSRNGLNHIDHRLALTQVLAERGRRPDKGHAHRSEHHMSSISLDASQQSPLWRVVPYFVGGCVALLLAVEAFTTTSALVSVALAATSVVLLYELVLFGRLIAHSKRRI